MTCLGLCVSLCICLCFPYVLLLLLLQLRLLVLYFLIPFFCFSVCLLLCVCFPAFWGFFFCEVGEEYFTEYLVNWSSKVQLFIYDTTELVEILISEALGSQDGSHLVIQFSLKQSRCFRMTGFHFFFNHGHTIWDKLKFSCEIAQCGKRSISICKKSFASTDKIFILGGRLGTKL